MKNFVVNWILDGSQIACLKKIQTTFSHDFDKFCFSDVRIEQLGGYFPLQSVR